jgi:hypothetical protein
MLVDLCLAHSVACSKLSHGVSAEQLGVTHDFSLHLSDLTFSSFRRCQKSSLAITKARELRAEFELKAAAIYVFATNNTEAK